MVAIANRVRTSLTIAGAAGILVAALLLHPPKSHERCCAANEIADDGMRLEARLTSTQVLAGAMDHDVAITIQAPNSTGSVRPPLSLVVVIDRSGSMTDSREAQPLSNAKAAAARLIGRLDARDAFSIVTYSSAAETVLAMSSATDANKQAARTAIEGITADGATCISCGISRAAAELARTPIRNGLSRIVLISDGQANEGIFDRVDPGGLSRLAAETAAHGVSISTLGVGLDFDEVTMQQLANVGRGRYYFVEDTRQLDAMFDRELGGLIATAAADARLVITDAPGTRIEQAYSYPMTRSGDHVIIPIADLQAGETRKVVLRVAVAPVATGPMTIARAELDWRRVGDGAVRHATATACVEVVEDPALVAANTDPETVEIVEKALSASALEEASEVYTSHGVDAARQVLEHRGAALRANKHLTRDVTERLDSDNNAALENLRTNSATKANKVNRVRAYQLAR